MRICEHTLYPVVMETDSQHKAILSDGVKPPCWYPDGEHDTCAYYAHCMESGDTCRVYRRYTEGNGKNPRKLWAAHVKAQLPSRGDKLGRFDDES